LAASITTAASAWGQGQRSLPKEPNPDGGGKGEEQPASEQPASEQPASEQPASTSYAPARTPAQPAREEPSEVRVIGSRTDALQKLPGSGTILGEKDLVRAQPVDTAEMLRRVPGIQVRQDYAGGNRLDISVRGLEGGRSRRVLVLEDGIPLAINPYSEPDMYYAPAIERYRAIEVVKGSGNILFGPQTLAGTVNFVTLSPPESQRAVADVDLGTYGYARGLANYGDRVGEVRYIVQLLHRRGDGFRNLPFDSTDALGKVSFPTGRDGDAMLKLGYRRDEAASDDVGLTSLMYRQDPRRASLSPTSHLVLHRYDVSLTHEQRFSRSTKLKTLVYAYQTDRVWRRQDYTRAPVAGQHYSRIVGDPTTPGAAIYFLNSNAILDRTYEVAGLEPRAEHDFETGHVAHHLDFGGRFLRELAHYSQRSGGYAETFAGSNDFEEKHTGTAFAAYVQDRIAFRDDLLVTPGIRFEQLTFDRVILRRSESGVARDTFEETRSTVRGVVPGIGIAAGKRQLNVFGGLHVGFAPPRVSSALSARGVSSTVNADESINYEVGARTMPVKWARVEATGFLSNFNNQVIVNTAPGADTTLTDAGATNLYGVESGTLVSFDKAFGLGTIMELGARYTFSRATFRYGPNAGNLLPYAPEHNFNANFDVEHPSGVGGQVAYAFTGPQFTDERNTVTEDLSGRIGQLGPRHIVDATVHYKHAPSGITLRLTAKNLLDAEYIIARRPEGIFAGPWRQVILGLRWQWEPEASSSR
jgi:Fe(3+) dicitrate transport protein